MSTWFIKKREKLAIELKEVKKQATEEITKIKFDNEFTKSEKYTIKKYFN